MKGAKGHHHRKGRAEGGRRVGNWASGDPVVEREAEGKESYADGAGREQKKRGGRAKRKDGGKVLGLMTGGNVRPRLDRPGRKRGGGVGSDRSPLSSAHRTSGAETHPKSEDSYGGTPK
jgi:hypothetical protein